MRNIVFALVVIMFTSCCVTQSYADNKDRTPPPPQPALAAPVRLPGPGIVPDGFPVRLRLTKTIDPRKVHPGDTVPFVLASDLYLRSLALAIQGQPVVAAVKEASGPRSFSRGSTLVLHVQQVTMLNGTPLLLRGTPRATGDPDYKLDLQATEILLGSTILPGVLFPPAAAVSFLLLAMPGNNVPLPEGTVTTAFVDGNVPLDLPTLQPLNTHPPVNEPAHVRIVKGIRGGPLRTDLFCNGTPIAHLARKRFVELDLQPGWYRFSIKPDHPHALLYVLPGTTYFLLADLSSVSETDFSEVNLNTIGFRSKRTRNFGGLMADSKPLDPSDFYPPATCTPLSEEMTLPTTPPIP